MSRRASPTSSSCSTASTPATSRRSSEKLWPPIRSNHAQARSPQVGPDRSSAQIDRGRRNSAEVIHLAPAEGRSDFQDGSELARRHPHLTPENSREAGVRETDSFGD